MGLDIYNPDLDMLPFCVACPLAETRTQVVLGSGNVNQPEFMFVGEAPGETEDRVGIPFLGQAGKILNEALLSVGINRANVYITNAVKCRPPKNRKPTKKELEACDPWFEEEVRVIQPKKIIFMGASAVKAGMGMELGKAREATNLTWGLDGIPVSCIYHPAACLHDPSKRVAFFEDVRRATVNHSEDGSVMETNRPSLPHANTIDEIWYDLLGADTLSVDIETTMDPSHKLLGIAISTREKSAWFMNFTDQYYRRALRDVCRSKRVIFHNAKFDVPILVREGLLDWDDIIIEDTYIMAYLLRKEKLGLKTLAEIDLGVQVVRLEDITLGKLDPSKVNQQDLGDYSCQDTRLAFQLYDKYLPELQATPMYAVYKHIDLPLIRVLADMENIGITVDIDHLARLDVSMKAEMELTTEAIKLVTDNPNFNPGSSQQVGKYLYEERGLPVLKLTDTGEPSTDAGTLKKLLEQNPNDEFIGLLLDDREIGKLHSTYVVGLSERALADPLQTHRVHTNFNMCIAETGRLSSSDPNLQNIPVRTPRGKQLRKAFIARPGWDLIVADQNQAEFRIVTCFSKDPNLINAYLEGRDMHKEVASMLNVDRRTGKTMNFGLLYGMGVTKLAAALGVSIKQATYLKDLYYEKIKGVGSYTRAAKEFAYSHGYCETYFGRRQYLPGLFSIEGGLRSAAERSSVNTPIQGTAADIMRMIMYDVWRRFREEDLWAKMLLQVHDELVIEAPHEESSFVMEIIDEASKYVLEPFSDMFVIPMTMEGKVCQSWADKG